MDQRQPSPVPMPPPPRLPPLLPQAWPPSSSASVPPLPRPPPLPSFLQEAAPLSFVPELSWPRSLDLQQAFDALQAPPSASAAQRPKRYRPAKYTSNWKKKRPNHGKDKQPVAPAQINPNFQQPSGQASCKRAPEQFALAPHIKRARGSRSRKRNPRFNTSWASNQNQAFYPPFQSRLQPSGFMGMQALAYQPPRLEDLQLQNRLKAFNHFPKRFGGRPNPFRPSMKGPQAPGAPLNTTSYLMRAKKSGGIASLVSPCPVTPAVLKTPVLSPFVLERGLAEEANREWGVDGYGSMNGLIRLRSLEFGRDDEDDSGSEVEQGVQSVQQLEQRLDHDLSRFVLTYPSDPPQGGGQTLLETRMDDQDSHIAHLEEENVSLKERLYVMQQEVEELRAKMRNLEGGGVSNDQEEAMSERSTADLSCL